MSQTVASFMIVGNHEIVGTVVERTPTFIVLSEPMVLRPVQKSADQYVLSFFPHSLSDPDGEHRFYYSQMISESVKVPAAVEKEYLKQTSSIILADALQAFEKL